MGRGGVAPYSQPVRLRSVSRHGRMDDSPTFPGLHLSGAPESQVCERTIELTEGGGEGLFCFSDGGGVYAEGFDGVGDGFRHARHGTWWCKPPERSALLPQMGQAQFEP